MARRIKDHIAQRALETFVGRKEELALLNAGLREDGPRVAFVHGIGGMGKSGLLGAFAFQARAQGATVIVLDCRNIEPTERGFLKELGAALGGDVTTAEEAAEYLGNRGAWVVLALDTYEVFRLLDTWLRQIFIPALPDNVLMVLSGREPPVPGWLISPGWQGLFRSIHLGPLSETEALTLLEAAGVGPEQGAAINRFARGHPLSLTLAAAMQSDEQATLLEATAAQHIVEELTRSYLRDISDPLTRSALDAASVVRRTNHSLLAAMLADAAPQDLFERLRVLPFVDSAPDGLHLHDSVQQAISSALRASDPKRYRDLRRAAWRRLRTEVRTVGKSELWRYTADMLYILENPVVREAFFPSSAHQLSVEPARPEDGAAIQAICERHEGPEAAKLLHMWWTRVPQAFQAVRDRDGVVAGFYCMFDPTIVPPACLQEDAVVRAWSDHLRGDPAPRNQHVLFLRRWLSLEQGEMPSPVQATCWLDAKRAYMEMRPHLRRVYGTLNDMATYGPTFQKLGFTPLPKPQVELDGRTYWVAVLDMGPSSVDGWLAGLVAAELGIEEGMILDSEARELVLDDKRVPLTRLEFGVMQHLYQYEGKVVTRASLLEEVWGYSYEGGSNVVDVVVRSLRKKLGNRASAIETVRSAGYRFRSA